MEGGRGGGKTASEANIDMSVSELGFQSREPLII